MDQILYRSLNQEEGEQFLKWADNWYDEQLKPLLKSFQSNFVTWHPVVREQLIQRFRDSMEGL